MSNLWHSIEAGTPESLNVIIEIPKLSRVKYELDKETGLIKFDRVLYSPMHYPANYGFVPRTLWDDGDPLDVLVMTHEELIPGALVEVRPIGVLPMVDGGEDDAKVLSVPAKDPRFKETADLKDLEQHLLAEIRHFFMTYKNLQGKEVKVGEWQDRGAAKKVVEKAIALYKDKYLK
ncbi:MAG: inorganic diphosphatase [Parcubacteria group bacterium]|nr:inorganic diphosphatase [Parcubacteria group bacterium]